jgi:hypothetical protein
MARRLVLENEEVLWVRNFKANHERWRSMWLGLWIWTRWTFGGLWTSLGGVLTRASGLYAVIELVRMFYASAVGGGSP